jgi:hypothetical protein
MSLAINRLMVPSSTCCPCISSMICFRILSYSLSLRRSSSSLSLRSLSIVSMTVVRVFNNVCIGSNV